MSSLSQSSLEIVRLRIGANRYVLPVSAVAAILDMSAVAHLDTPYVGPWIGAIRSHQSTIRVADGLRIFGEQRDSTSLSKVVVLRSAHTVGITVDEVLGSAVVSRGDVYQMPATVGSARQLLVSSIVWVDGAAELAIDLPALVGALSDNDITLDPHALPPVTTRFEDAGDEVLEVRVGGSAEAWGLPIGAVRHVARYRQPQPLGRAASGVAGLLSWQRHPIPVIAVSLRLGLSAADDCSGQVVVIGEPVRAGQAEQPAVAALAVEAVIGIQSVGQQAGDQLHTDSGAIVRSLDLTRLLNGGYRADSRATVFVSDPMPSMPIVT